MLRCKPRKIFLTAITFIAGVLMLTSTVRGQEQKTGATTFLADGLLYEPLLIPNKSDTDNFNAVKDKYPSFLNGDFIYEYIPYVRGLVDTSLCSNAHHKFKELDEDLQREMIESPLIVEGEVIAHNWDSTGSLLFCDNISIKITDIVKSKYNLCTGDTVLAISNVFNFYNPVLPRNASVAEKAVRGPYRIGRKYIFCFNKYFYMHIMYRM